MRRTTHILMLGLALVASAGAQARTVDRVVAVVGRQVVTQSEWDGQERFQAMTEGRPPQDLRFNDESLRRMIDRRLVLAQLEEAGYSPVTSAEAATQVTRVRQESGWTEAAAWRSALSQYGLAEAEFTARVREQMDVLRFIEQRFRPIVQVTREQARRYYRERFVPEMQTQGMNEDKIPAFEAVEAQVTRIVTEQKVNEVFADWLDGLRSQTPIRILR